MKIGVISDTHGYLDPRIEEIFRGVDGILHAGDVGEGILARLEAIAPVEAVAGNMDGEPLASALPKLREIQLAGRKALIVHRLEEPRARVRMESGDLDLVVHGHTHRADARREEDLLIFNPGAAGRSYSASGRSVGILEIAEDGIRYQIIELSR